MALDKTDLKEIKKIVADSVGGVEKRLGEKIKKSEDFLIDRMDFLIEKSENRLEARIEKTENRLEKKIEETKEEIVNRINAEVSDLSDINRAVILRNDQIDYRLRIVERKLGIIQ